MRKLIRAWNPDFTKLTSKEAAELRLAREQIIKGEVYSDDDIDWDNLDELDLQSARK